MRQPKSAPAPSPARPPAVVKARRRVFYALALLAVAALLLWAVWPGDGLDAARAALDRRDFAGAYQVLNARLAERPDDAAAHLLAARACRRGGDLPRATEHLRKYQGLRGADAAHATEARHLRAQGGELAEADRLFAEAIDKSDAESALALEAYLEGSLKAVSRSNDPRAAAEARDAPLRRAIDQWRARRPGREDQVQGLLWLTVVCGHVKDHPTGVAALRELLTLDADHFGARFLLAQALAQEKPEETREHLEHLRAKHPDNVQVRYGLAASYRVTGRPADARRLLEGLLDGPVHLSASVELATLDLDEGQVPAAERRLREVLAVAPNVPEANLAMSRCQRLAGRPDEADKFRTKYEELEAARTKK